MHCGQLCCPHAPAFRSTGDSFLSGVGIALLVCLTYLVSRNRGASVTSDLIKHIAVVAIVIVASGLIGSWIGNLMHDGRQSPFLEVAERRPRQPELLAALINKAGGPLAGRYRADFADFGVCCLGRAAKGIHGVSRQCRKDLVIIR